MYSVEQTGPDRFDVTERGRSVGYDWDWDDVMDLLRKKSQKWFEVIEPDGYRSVQSLTWRP